MLTKRIIPCLDVKDGRVVKGINFVNLRDAGDPVETAKIYNEAGADELLFLDINASAEGRRTILDVAAAEREQQPVEAHGLLLQILRRGLYDLRQLLALPPSVQNRQAVRFFIRRDPRSRLHPLGKQLQKLRVDPVDLCSVIRKFHSDIHPFRKYKRKTRHSVICAALRT